METQLEQRTDKSMKIHVDDAVDVGVGTKQCKRHPAENPQQI